MLTQPVSATVFARSLSLAAAIVLVAPSIALPQSLTPLNPVRTAPDNPPADDSRILKPRTTTPPADSESIPGGFQIHSNRDPNSPVIANVQAWLLPDSVPPVDSAAEPQPESGSPPRTGVFRTGVVRIDVELAEGSHIYSLTLNDPRQTRIELSHSPAITIAGPAQPSRHPDNAPAAVANEKTAADAEVDGEAYNGTVSFFVPLQFAESVSLENEQVLVRLNAMLCSDEGFCLPVRDRIARAQPVPSPEALPSSRAALPPAAATDFSGSRKQNP